ncbi:MAG: OsmC family protein [Desulfuromonadales bacterium]|nr:OsmC family protein [Desulfuromonadales bacterium]
MTSTDMINGVDVARLNDTITAIKHDPEIALFRFRATNRWDNGGHNTTTIHDFYGAKQTISHAHDFHIDADEPSLLLGSDMGANPVEIVLTALAGCLTTTLVYHAAARGITIRGVESELEGELDLRGFLGLSDEVRNGYKSLCVNMRVDADASRDTLEELVTIAKGLSPVADIISNPVEVLVKLDEHSKTTH